MLDLVLKRAPFGIGPVTLTSATQAPSAGFTSALNLICVIWVSAVTCGYGRTSQATERVLVVVEYVTPDPLLQVVQSYPAIEIEGAVGVE